MTKHIMAAALITCLLMTPAHADVTSTTLSTNGDWTTQLITPDAQGKAEGQQAWCAVETLLSRASNDATGMVMVSTFVNGDVELIVMATDWTTITRNRDYGSVLVVIGDRTWRARARGNSAESIVANIPDGREFLAEFQNGTKLYLKLPNDMFTVGLQGSRAAIASMNRCWEALDKRDPFAGSKRDPFAF